MEYPEYPITGADVDVRRLKVGDVVRIQPYGTLHIVTSEPAPLDRGEYDDYRICVAPPYGGFDFGSEIDVEWDGAPTSSDKPWIDEIRHAVDPLSGELVHPLVGDEVHTTDGLWGEVVVMAANRDTITVTITRDDETHTLTFRLDGTILSGGLGGVTHLVRCGRAIFYPGVPAAPGIAESYDPRDIEEDDE